MKIFDPLQMLITLFMNFSSQQFVKSKQKLNKEKCDRQILL